MGTPTNISDLLAVATGERAFQTILVQLCVIIAAARILSALFKKLRQPIVVGEILAGIVLGPSLFGRFFPEISSKVFDPAVAEVFTALAQLGLVLLLFNIGLEFDFVHLKSKVNASISISAMGTVLPFGLGLWLGHALVPYLGLDVSPWPFALFMGTTLSITALPILGRIMLELNFARTRLGTVTITSAAIDDAVGWILLASVTAVVQAAYDPSVALRMSLMTAGFFLLVAFVIRPVVGKWLAQEIVREHGLGLRSMTVLLIMLFLCALATSKIGIFTIFGAFVLGAVLSQTPGLREAVRERLSGITTVLFLPVFFTYTGLRTNIGSLDTSALWLAAGAVSLVAIFGKLVGCTTAARLSGFSWREAGCIGAMMNTRALMALIVINIGKDLGVLPENVFSMLVMMAVVTTIMTTPLLLTLSRKTSLEPLIAESEFMRPNRAS
ncbi:MAG TPA: cation:proton antiporter [Fimbriimonadaceae bacterium]|nr:cation:proton antiporter [Fimbriimonadaceae bacterium]